MQTTLDWFKRVYLRTRVVVTSPVTRRIVSTGYSTLKDIGNWALHHLEQLCLLPLLIAGSSAPAEQSVLLGASFLGVLLLQNALSEIVLLGVFMGLYGKPVLEGTHQLYVDSHTTFAFVAAGSFLLCRLIGVIVKYLIWGPIAAAQSANFAFGGCSCLTMSRFWCYYLAFLGLKLGGVMLIYLGFFIDMPLLALAGFMVLLSITGVGNLIAGLTNKYQEHSTYVYTLLLVELVFVLAGADMTKLRLKPCDYLAPESWGYALCHEYMGTTNL